MFNSLQKIAALPDETKVYCAHEYTSSNIAFALVAEQDNPHLQRYREDVSRLRAQGISTIPSTLRQEKLINPFLRCDQASIKKNPLQIRRLTTVIWRPLLHCVVGKTNFDLRHLSPR